MSNGTRPTAVFCENWRVCQSVIKAASELDISVPKDLSLVGYGQNILEITDPVPVTAYVPNSTEIGKAAVRLLLRIVDGEEAPDEPIMIPGHIVKGASVLPLNRPSPPG